MIYRLKFRIKTLDINIDKFKESIPIPHSAAALVQCLAAFLIWSNPPHTNIGPRYLFFEQSNKLIYFWGTQGLDFLGGETFFYFIFVALNVIASFLVIFYLIYYFGDSQLS